MKRTSKFLILTIVVFMLMQVVLPTISQANEMIKLNIQEERPYDDINEDQLPDNNVYKMQRLDDALQPIFKIGEQGEEGSLTFENAYYCLRGGLGFGSTSTILPEGVDYRFLANLSDSTTIKNYYKEIGYDITDDNYNAICWIAENMYLPTSPYAEDLKAELLENAQITDSQLTDDDIEVIQQIALWYFSNYDTNGEGDSLSLPNNIELENLLKINGEEPDYNDKTVLYNKTKAGQITKLYQYFIENALNGTIETKTPIKIELNDELNPTIEKKDNAYVVGPFKIDITEEGNVEYDFSYELKYRTNLENDAFETIPNLNTNVYLSDENGFSLDRVKDMKEMVGENEFYITILNIPNIREVSLKINYNSSYYNTDATVWVAELKDQPVLKVEKEKITDSGSDNITVQKSEEPVKEFDLALRKFITETNGQEVTNRIPEIYLETLKNGTYNRDGELEYTATYEHDKTPILLKRGDTIVYTIRVYNEGEIDGYAKEVTDYLCDELEFVEDSEINNTYRWKVSKDGKTLKTDYLNDTLIKAYDPNVTEELLDRDDLWQKSEDGDDGLYYADLLVECKIKDTAQDFMELPNVAAITEDLAVGEIDIPDRDSDPIDLNESELRDYVGSIQDDDDYEMVKVEPDKAFDLALRKYITKVNGTAVANTREPAINDDELDAKTSSTANYNHRKDPVEVKIGDVVTYNLSIYNEGEAVGRATKIVDQLPTGIEFVRVVSGNYELESYDERTNTVTLKEKANNENLAAKEEGRELSSTTVEIECIVTAKVENNDQILTNVAWIAEDFNAENQAIIDRDSKPERAPEVNKDNMSDYTGNENKEELDDSGYYYKGQEDDDDFEKLVIRGKIFDLALRKYITKVNDTEVTNTRMPEINADELDAGTSTTAEYKHRKDPVEVKTEDIVTYNLTIYNEGEIAGRATKIVDQLPIGLEFVSVVSGNYVLENYDEETNTITLKETENNENLEAKEEGRMSSSTTVEIACKVTAVVSENDQILTNVAWIAEDYNAENNEINDRDSKPEQAPNVNKDNMSDYTGNENKDELDDSGYYYKGQQDDDDFEKLVIRGKNFDLALRKYIDYIERKGESVEFESRIPQVDTKPLTEGKTTANYIHSKNTLTVKQGDIITYKLRVYNEGELDGFVTEITDYIPEGLGLLLGYTGNANWLLDSETKTPQALVGEDGIYKTKEDVPVNGIFENEDLESMQVVTGKEGTLKIVDNTSLDDKMIRHFGEIAEEGELYQDSINPQDKGLFYQEVEVTCIVLAPNTYEGTITNIAEISEDKAIDELGTEVNIEDRDSNLDNVMEDEKHTPGDEENGYTPGEQDDDDFEPVQLKYFDLALKKFITGVNEEVVDTRIPEFYIDENGEYKYKHDKTSVEVTDKDDVTYTIRVFNEGTLDGYAEEIEDDIPEGLIFLPENETNKEYGWKMYYYNEEGVLTETNDVEKATVIRTTYLSEANGEINEETGENSNLLTKFDKETMESPDYRDVKVVFKVSQADIPEENEDRIIVNKAHITKDSDDDEDSIPDEWNEGEDDQDKEYIYVQEFDLALYKWVSKTIVTVDGKTTETETGFKPNVGKTEGEGDKYRPNSEQEPIASVTIDKKKLKSTVVKFVYNIKVVNEGDISGYATEITDYIPEGLKFVSEDNPLWTLGEDGKITTRALETTILDPGMSATVPVTFTWINDANNLGVKTNIAAITEDYNEKDVDDVDSVPGNEDIPNYDKEIEKEQEDDDDFALVILQLKTGKNITYIGLMLLCVTIISAGAITIKKYVL